MRRVNRARLQAIALLEKHGVSEPPVDIYSIATDYAKVQEIDLPDEVSGALVPTADGRFVIAVNETHSPNRKRFTVAHELCHLLVHQYKTPHADRSFMFRNARSSDGKALDEIEANRFASELLMPAHLLFEDLDLNQLDYVLRDEAFADAVESLAAKYEVSEQAMSIRLGALLA